MAHDGVGRGLEAANTPPTMIVGVHGPPDDGRRLKEYSPGFDAGQFAPHEAFFVDVVGRWVQSRLGVTMPANRTAVWGASLAGGLAIALTLRHPERYGAAFSASPGAGYRPPEVVPSVLPRTYLVAGTEEPFFMANAIRWAEAWRDAAW